MSDSHDAHDIQQHVKRYLFVFYALIVGTRPHGGGFLAAH